MKRLLLIVLILCLAMPVSAQQIVVMKKKAGASMNTTDMSRGFEIAAGSRGDSASWSETDTASLLDDSATAAYHSGSKSMSVLGNDTTLAYQRYDAGATRATVSISLWFYYPSSSANDDTVSLLQFGTSSTGTYGMIIGFKKASGSYYFVTRGDGGFVSGTQAITANAWYRLEIAYAQNAASSLKIYNTSGTLVDTVDFTAANNNSRYLFIGKIAASATTGWGTLYFDDLGMDWTDATTPLHPFTIAD